MAYYGAAVAAVSDVKLESVTAVRQGQIKRLDSIFRRIPRRAAMTKQQWTGALTSRHPILIEIDVPNGTSGIGHFLRALDRFLKLAFEQIAFVLLRIHGLAK